MLTEKHIIAKTPKKHTNTFPTRNSNKLAYITYPKNDRIAPNTRPPIIPFLSLCDFFGTFCLLLFSFFLP